MSTISHKHSIPEGYKFLPTKEDIFVFYLHPLIKGQPLPSDVIVERDIYGENKEPWKLFDKDSKHSNWVSTKLKKKSKSKIERTAGCGSWLNRSIKEVRNSRGKLLGFHRYFIFTYKKAKSSRRDNGYWIMHEYSINEDEGSRVICEIRNKDAEEKTLGEKRKTPEVDEDVDARMSVKKVCDPEGNASRDQNKQDFGHQEHHTPTLDSTSCCSYSSSYNPQVNMVEWPGQLDFFDGSVFDDNELGMDLESFGNALGWKDFENNGILVPSMITDLADEGYGSNISGTLSLDQQSMIRNCGIMDETHGGQADDQLNNASYFSYLQRLLFGSDHVPDMADFDWMASSSIEDQSSLVS